MPRVFILNVFFYMSLIGLSQRTHLDSFYSSDELLQERVQQIFHSLTDEERVAQMIVTSAGELGKKDEVVLKLAQENKIGGVVFLKGSKESHKKLIDELDLIGSKQNQIPLLYSIDAEPSLFNGRLKGSPKLMRTIDIKTTKECDSIVSIINEQLLDMRILHNFAPVVDISPKNEAIKNRSFGNDREMVGKLCQQFIQTSQKQGVIATAKHFPGHGLVSGDTHKNSVYIDGELKELDMYPPLIESGVLSIMIAHITIINNPKYDTEGLPSSCSRKIVTDLLKEEMGFEGLIITDALNIMKAVTIVDNAPLLASKAGNDMLLMPIDESETIRSILNEMQSDEAYKEQVYTSVKKIIRMKLCAGLME